MIAAVIPSFGRLPVLARLLTSLRAVQPVPPRVIVVDDRGGGDAERMVASIGLPDALVLAPGRNLGTGGSVALGFQHALTDPAVRYCVQLDDDAVVEPTAFAGVQRILERTTAGAAGPMIRRADGGIGWFPGLQDRHKWRVVLRARGKLLPEQYLEACGPDPVRFTWGAWPVMMFKREAIERVGLPRQDIWYQAVDLEYMLRLAASGENLWVPTESSWHLPPDQTATPRKRYWRDCIGLQNCSYIFGRLPHGRRALRHLPGNFRTFFREWGVGPRPLYDATRCFHWGMVRGQPTGRAGFTYYRDSWLHEARTQ